jgi:two-component system, chemotaxis family, chemotaxis protein CheY
MKILIVDDDSASLKVLSLLMKSYGKTDTCTYARDALQKTEQAFSDGVPFELFMIDIMMPEINGHELLAEIRNLEKEHNVKKPANIIMVSALSDTENIMNAFNAKCDAYIIKPIRKDKLEQELSRIGIKKK